MTEANELTALLDTYRDNDNGSGLWPLMVLDAFLHLHCTWRHHGTEYQLLKAWVENMIVAGVRATEGES